MTPTDERSLADAAPGHPGGHDAGDHVSPERKDHRERLALWLFIGGDLVFLMLELFTWFYLRALNTHDMWRCASPRTHSCTDWFSNPITHEVPKANPAPTIIIALLAVGAALLLWGAESSARRLEGRGRVGIFAVSGLVLLLFAVVTQCIQFGFLPFTTVEGTYASSFEFFMGSTLVHLLLLTIIVLGLWNRVRIGRYEGGNWYQTRLVRMFAVWIAVSTCVLALVMSLFT